MSALPAPRTGIRDRVEADACYPDCDVLAAVAVEIVSEHLERCWYGSGPRDFFARFTPAYHTAQAAAYGRAVAAMPEPRPMPIGSRFD